MLRNILTFRGRRQPAEAPEQALARRISRLGADAPFPARVARFEAQFPGALAAVMRGVVQARRHFPDARRVLVDVFADCLTIIIEVDDPRGATAARDRFDQQWWYGLPLNVAMRVTSHVRSAAVPYGKDLP